MTKAEELYHQIADDIPEVKEGKMFGALCLKTPNGKAAVMFWKEHMVFRLTKEDQEQALKLDGAKVFAPMENRPMNGWIQVPYKHHEQWKQLTIQSVAVAKAIKK